MITSEDEKLFREFWTEDKFLPSGHGMLDFDPKYEHIFTEIIPLLPSVRFTRIPEEEYEEYNYDPDHVWYLWESDL